MAIDPCPPGSHPHEDRRNWKPATTFEEYFVNCREGLEQFSERRAAKLLGWPRIALWRAIRMADVPDELFEALLDAGAGSREIAEVGRVLRGEAGPDDAERSCCPNCGHVLRIRPRINAKFRAIVDRHFEIRRVA